MALLIFVFGIAQALAEPEYDCHTIVGEPAQVFEAATKSDCFGVDGKKAAAVVNGKKEILCMYNAGCRTLLRAKEDGPLGPIVNAQEMWKLTTYGEKGEDPKLKASTLVCKGELILANGKIVNQPGEWPCPNANKCRTDIFYHSQGARSEDMSAHDFNAPAVDEPHSAIKEQKR